MNNEFHLKQLQPSFRLKVEKALVAWNSWAATDECKMLFGGTDVVVGIISSRRDIYLQAGLYSQGRTWNKNFQKWVISDEGAIVTRTLHSKHLDGLAVDVTPFVAGKATWPDPAAPLGSRFWKMIRDIGEACNMKAGARFLKPDWPHFEEFDTIESNVVPLRSA